MHSANSHDNEPESKNCCENETVYVKSEADQHISASVADIKLNPVLLSVLFVALQIELPSSDAQSLSYLNYKPPSLVCDLPVRLQTFLC